jgi:hypothetical protein
MTSRCAMSSGEKCGGGCGSKVGGGGSNVCLLATTSTGTNFEHVHALKVTGLTQDGGYVQVELVQPGLHLQPVMSL